MNVSISISIGISISLRCCQSNKVVLKVSVWCASPTILIASDQIQLKKILLSFWTQKNGSHLSNIGAGVYKQMLLVSNFEISVEEKQVMFLVYDFDISKGPLFYKVSASAYTHGGGKGYNLSPRYV